MDTTVEGSCWEGIAMRTLFKVRSHGKYIVSKLLLKARLKVANISAGLANDRTMLSFRNLVIEIFAHICYYNILMSKT